MANKMASFLIFCVVIAAVSHHAVPAAADEFAVCFNGCQKECIAQGQGQTFCEMKCDSDCFDKDVSAKLHIKTP